MSIMTFLGHIVMTFSYISTWKLFQTCIKKCMLSYLFVCKPFQYFAFTNQHSINCFLLAWFIALPYHFYIISSFTAVAIISYKLCWLLRMGICPEALLVYCEVSSSNYKWYFPGLGCWIYGLMWQKWGWPIWIKLRQVHIPRWILQM